MCFWGFRLDSNQSVHQLQKIARGLILDIEAGRVQKANNKGAI